MHLALADDLTQQQHLRGTTLRDPLIDKNNWKKPFIVLQLWVFKKNFKPLPEGTENIHSFPHFPGGFFPFFLFFTRSSIGAWSVFADVSLTPDPCWDRLENWMCKSETARGLG